MTIDDVLAILKALLDNNPFSGSDINDDTVFDLADVIRVIKKMFE